MQNLLISWWFFTVMGSWAPSRTVLTLFHFVLGIKQNLASHSCERMQGPTPVHFMVPSSKNTSRKIKNLNQIMKYKLSKLKGSISQMWFKSLKCFALPLDVCSVSSFPYLTLPIISIFTSYIEISANKINGTFGINWRQLHTVDWVWLPWWLSFSQASLDCDLKLNKIF